MLLWLILTSVAWLPTPPLAAEPVTVFEDQFAAGALDEAKWVRTVLNDFEREVVDVVEGRLRLGASTVGTDDATVKFHGVRTKEPVVDLTGGVRVSFVLDWNNQANGCYMTAGAVLCPTVAADPLDEPSWLQVTYIGVPPGENARCVISIRAAGQEKMLLTENWPEERTGRRIGVQEVEIAIDPGTVFVSENGKTILEAQDLHLDFDRAYLYLQHSSHSNYRLREVFFDGVTVKK